MCWMYGCAFEKRMHYYPRYQGIKQNLACIRFSKLLSFKFILPPPLNILTIPDWLNVKFHCFLIGPKVNILNT